MRAGSLAALLGLLLAPAVAGAGLNRTFLVPAYEACPGAGNCNPPTRSSPFTFDQVVLYSSPAPYTGPGKLALQLKIKGLRDGSGTLFNGTVQLRVGASRVTILTNSVGTLGETSPLLPSDSYTIQVSNGSARFKYKTPSDTPKTGLVVNSLGTPTLYDPDGKAIATTGTQTKR